MGTRSSCPDKASRNFECTRPIHNVRDTWLSQGWREEATRGILLDLRKIVATLARGRRRCRGGGRLSSPGARQSEGETHGQEASADRADRRLAGAPAALLVARAGRVRADTPPRALRQPRR